MAEFNIRMLYLVYRFFLGGGIVGILFDMFRDFWFSTLSVIFIIWMDTNFMNKFEIGKGFHNWTAIWFTTIFTGRSAVTVRKQFFWFLCHTQFSHLGLKKLPPESSSSLISPAISVDRGDLWNWEKALKLQKKKLVYWIHSFKTFVLFWLLVCSDIPGPQ